MRGRSMTEWSVGLETMGFKELAAGVDQDKLVSLRLINELGLPTYPRVITPVPQLEADPAAAFGQLSIDRYFTILAPMRSDLLRYRRPNLTDPEVLEFIRETLTPEIKDKYVVVLEQSMPHAYGGNVVCRPDGGVIVEMISGNFGHNQLISGAQPEFTASRDSYSGRFLYSFEDRELRAAVWRTILAIPHAIEGQHAAEFAYRGLRFHAGYYEFNLDQPDGIGPLKPHFIDYTAQPAFQAPA